MSASCKKRPRCRKGYRALTVADANKIGFATADFRNLRRRGVRFEVRKETDRHIVDPEIYVVISGALRTVRALNLVHHISHLFYDGNEEEGLVFRTRSDGDFEAQVPWQEDD